MSKLNVTIRAWGTGQQLYRVHPEHYGADQFNTSTTGDARFSPLIGPDNKLIPTMYAGSTLDCALMETVFHDVAFVNGPKLHSKAKHVTGKVASTLRVTRNLRLVDLTSVALRKLGTAPERLTRTDASAYSKTRAWALAIHEQEPKIDGLLWTSRQDDTAFAVLLFGDRVDEEVLMPSRESMRLSLPDGSPRDEVLALASRLDVLLI